MQFYNNSIFWIEVEKIKPNPFQPRIEFDEERLRDLAISIRQYGILQPLVVTRKEVQKEDGGLVSEYELISGERRLRASKIAGLTQVPAIIKSGENDDKLKLELAIIENLQREDLNPLDRAKAFKKLADEFGLKHGEIGQKVGKSREYVSNSIRLLLLPEEMQLALAEGKISEGHTRPLLMLIDRKAEQTTLFKEIMLKKMTVRETEKIARQIAFERARKFDDAMRPEIIEMQEKLSEALGTRVSIERKAKGGKIHIDFFDEVNLRDIAEQIKHSLENKTGEAGNATEALSNAIPVAIAAEEIVSEASSEPLPTEAENPISKEEEKQNLDDRSKEEVKLAEEEEENYNLDNFTI